MAESENGQPHFQPLKEVDAKYRLYGPVWILVHALSFSGVVVTETGDYEHIFLPMMLCFMHAGVFLWSKWSFFGERILNTRLCASLSTATHIASSEASSLLPRRILRILRDSKGGMYVEHECERLYYDGATNSFVRPRQYDEERVAVYTKSAGLSAHALSVSHAPAHWEIPLPGFFDLFREHLLDPFFVFQLFCVFLWLLDEYWNYALLTLFMLLLLEVQMVHRRLADMRHLRAVKPPVVPVRILRDRAWIQSDSSKLLPGDLVEIGAELPSQNLWTVPCDIVLISGNCLVNESMLTGESVPVLKEALDGSDERKLDMEGVHRTSCLFAGSEVIDRGGAVKPRGIVVRTGFATSQGQLVRSMLFASERVTAASQEAYAFLGVLLMVAVAATGYVVWEGLYGDLQNKSRFKLMLSVSHILTSVVPPEFPVTMSLTVTLALVQLARCQVYCTEPFRIPLAGKTKTCCFDKTGTLTSQEMKLEQVVDLSSGEQVSLTANEVLLHCHSVCVTASGEVVGDPIEVAALRGVSIPAQGKKKTFHFDPSLQRMSVVVGDKVLVKGSPERVFACLRHPAPDSVENACNALTQKGFRVLALAGKIIISPVTDRTQAESELELLGLAAFSYTIKPNTARVIKTLQAAGIRCVMVTGDHRNTSTHVARAVGILDPGTAREFNNESEAAVASGDPSEIIASLRAEEILVWSRCSPADKQKIVLALEGSTLFCGDGTNDVAALKSASVGVAISALDTGAVKSKKNLAPDMFLSSSTMMSHASIAAPFVHTGHTIRSVLSVIRSGRTTLALTMQMYKILAVNSLVTAFCLSVLTVRGVKLGDTQSSIESLYLSLLSFAVSRGVPGKDLLDEKKIISSVFAPSVIFSIFAQATLHLVLLTVGQAGITTAITGGSITDQGLDSGIASTDKFHPSLPNTIAFIQLFAGHISTMVANYDGLPALPSLRSNKPVAVLVLVGVVVVMCLVSGVLPEVNELFELELQVDQAVQQKLFLLVLGHLVGGCFIGWIGRRWDRLGR